MDYDAVIVLCKNVGYLGSKNKIRNSINYLSPKSELNVIAGALFFKKNQTKILIFSGGKTAGKNYPSEAEAMRNFLISKYPDIPESSIILEDKSFDTKQNAKNSKLLIENNNFKRISFITTKAHIPRSKKLFKDVGLDIEGHSAEEIVERNAPEIFEEYKKEFGISEVYLEKLALILQSIPLISSIGNFLIEKRRQLD